MCTVQPVTFTPAARASRTACQPLNAGSSAGWVLTMRSGKGVVDRLLEDGAEAGHRDEVDVEPGERVDDLVGVGDAVEVAPEARALHHLDRDAGGAATSIAPHGAVDEDHDDGEVGAQERVQDRAAARRQHTDPPHVGNVAQPALGLRVLEVARAAWSDCPKPRRLSGGRDWRRNGHGPEQAQRSATRVIAVSGILLFIFSLLPLATASTRPGPSAERRRQRLDVLPCAGSPSCSACCCVVYVVLEDRRTSKLPDARQRHAGARSSSSSPSSPSLFILIKLIMDPGTAASTSAVRRLKERKIGIFLGLLASAGPGRRGYLNVKESGELARQPGRPEGWRNHTPDRLIDHDRRRRCG